MRAGAWGPAGCGARVLVHSDHLPVGRWRSCCAAALTPTWCLRMARRPYIWRPGPDTREVCAAWKLFCAEEGTPTLGEAGPGPEVGSLKQGSGLQSEGGNSMLNVGAWRF